MKYKVIFERSNCIGAGTCAAVYQERWTLTGDGKADLKDGKQAGTNVELIIDESELPKMMESAQICPVNVIHIEDETGKRII